MKKILFPFFDQTKHSFILKQSWFRGVIALYVLFALIFVPYYWGQTVLNDYYDCKAQAEVRFGSDPALRNADQAVGYYDAYKYCSQIAKNEKENWLYPTITVAIEVAVAHYLIQFLFFTVLINFIALGKREEDKS